MSKSVLKTTAWATHKILKRVYDKVIVDMTDLKIIRQLQERAKHPIILIPTRKSYIDMVLIAYVFFAYGLKHPFFCTPSQYLDIRLINRIFRSCGSFYVRDHEENELYEAALKEYISILLGDKQTISCSIEETREKSGMLVRANPKVFNTIIDGYFNGRTSDVDIIPVTINYDRILEGETFPYELAGEEKVQESFTRFVSSARFIGTPFGKACINFGKKISLHEY
jgi:glycerol-3-phosphate O-acyltransferase